MAWTNSENCSSFHLHFKPQVDSENHYHRHFNHSVSISFNRDFGLEAAEAPTSRNLLWPPLEIFFVALIMLDAWDSGIVQWNKKFAPSRRVKQFKKCIPKVFSLSFLPRWNISTPFVALFPYHRICVSI